MRDVRKKVRQKVSRWAPDTGPRARVTARLWPPERGGERGRRTRGGEGETEKRGMWVGQGKGNGTWPPKQPSPYLPVDFNSCYY